MDSVWKATFGLEIVLSLAMTKYNFIHNHEVVFGMILILRSFCNMC